MRITYDELFQDLVRANLKDMRPGFAEAHAARGNEGIASLYRITVKGLRVNPTCTPEFLNWVINNQQRCETIIAGCIGLLA